MLRRPVRALCAAALLLSACGDPSSSSPADVTDGDAADTGVLTGDTAGAEDGTATNDGTTPTDTAVSPGDTTTGPGDTSGTPDTVTPIQPPVCGDCTLSCGAHGRCEHVQGVGPACLCEPGYQDHDDDGSCLPACATAALACGSGQACSDTSGTATCVNAAKPPIYIAFHWHMHQPIYWPYEKISQTEASHQGDMGYSFYQIHNDRYGNYTSWPKNAVAAGAGLAHLGAQVSLSGSLMENLDSMAGAGAGFGGWVDPWKQGAAMKTSLGNPRLDLVAFGYHHPLMGLIDPQDMRFQLATHRTMADRHFGGTRSKGIFPPECAFSERMIPALVAEGLEWSFVDNIHFDRAHRDYPFAPESNLPAPNRADQTNQAPLSWESLNDLWAPGKVSAPWGYQPHWVEYRDPATCEVSRMIAVPAARYEGNEDARGGFGALSYEKVLSQHEPYNTDPDHPMLVVLHHDGDNYGGGTDSYYHANFQNFVAWVQSQPDRFVATTVQDYLDLFPPDPDDVIHVEDGSWSGADNGDPEFHKWNGDPAGDGYSPDRTSWAVITAAKNRVLTAEAITPHTSVDAILDGSGNDTDKAWHYLLNGETSCYWYWDGTGAWDSHPARAANLAVPYADNVIGGGADTVPPTIYLPQREPYNPGLGNEPEDFDVWTFAYDVSGLAEVSLYVRVDADGVRTGANDIYAGGDWTALAMTRTDVNATTNPSPTYVASAYSARVDAAKDTLVDYYVLAKDSGGREARSPIMHVWVGSGGATNPTGDPLWTPANPTRNDVITIVGTQPANVHWGVDGWKLPPAEYWPAGSTAWTDGKAIESPLSGPDGDGKYTLELGPFDQTAVGEVNWLFHAGDDWYPGDQTITIAP